ncbi:hypothetical protein BV898_19402 [Hypsibius exemplaris]|uniref:Uncharacterized protein n=1 Tax=Hypsibius exemplaris TaxID=2072580 RepID=A0A9X6NJ09_HYPEX|nr:hypothetical protein BV898_19402 [Hypsibius exemplaris]
MKASGRRYFLTAFVLLAVTDLTYGTWRYYNTYLSYGSGDTMIQTFHAQGGTNVPHKKWNVECLDGEAIVGISDWWDDFERLEQVWCKFMFPNKPSSNGMYPYYSGCHVRNITDTPICYNAQDHVRTVNTFVTGFWNASWFWFMFRTPGIDDLLPYKCCKTPPGYYIDYMSCYYVPTHDVFFEYYDNTFNFVVYCSNGYVMTGLGRKVNQYSREGQIDWIQCCRVGLGKPFSVQPPVIYSKSGAAAYYAPGSTSGLSIPAAYQAQYRSDLGEDASNVDDHQNILQRNYTTTVDLKKRRSRPKHPLEEKTKEARPELHHLLARDQRTPRPGSKDYAAIEKAYNDASDAEEVRMRFRPTRREA